MACTVRTDDGRSERLSLAAGGSHVLGTDGAGMDIFSRVVFAPRVDLAIAIIGTFLSAMIGGVIGAIVGY